MAEKMDGHWSSVFSGMIGLSWNRLEEDRVRETKSREIKRRDPDGNNTVFRKAVSIHFRIRTGPRARRITAHPILVTICIPTRTE
jgi:hypothetical protein